MVDGLVMRCYRMYVFMSMYRVIIIGSISCTSARNNLAKTMPERVFDLEQTWKEWSQELARKARE